MKNYDIPSANREALRLAVLKNTDEAADWYSRALGARSRSLRKICRTMGDMHSQRVKEYRHQLLQLSDAKSSTN